MDVLNVLTTIPCPDFTLIYILIFLRDFLKNLDNLIIDANYAHLKNTEIFVYLNEEFGNIQNYQ
jgi:hypothetical protein